jgi:hypothetical protein
MILFRTGVAAPNAVVVVGAPFTKKKKKKTFVAQSVNKKKNKKCKKQKLILIYFTIFSKFKTHKSSSSRRAKCRLRPKRACATRKTDQNLKISKEKKILYNLPNVCAGF